MGKKTKIRTITFEFVNSVGQLRFNRNAKVANIYRKPTIYSVNILLNNKCFLMYKQF